METAIFEKGQGIFGIGNTLQEAFADATNEYVLEQDEIQDDPEHGEKGGVFYAPITTHLADRARNGDSKSIYLVDGVLCHSDEVPAGQGLFVGRAHLQLGDRVVGGSAEDERDTGTVQEVRGDLVHVAWDQGGKTWSLISTLTRE